MKTNFKILFSLLFLSLLFSCKPGSITKYKKIIPTGAQTYPMGFADTLAAYYTGCGGLVLQFRGEQILFDPFFSNTAIRDLKKLKSNATSIEGVLLNMQLNNIVPSKIKSVFIAHSHYDHLYDLPYLLQNKRLNNEVSVYGSYTTKNILDAALDNNLYHFNLLPNKNTKPYGWIEISPYIKVLPIKVAHNSHALHFIKIMRGKGKAAGIKDYDTHNYQSNAYKWKEGNTYAFLVELTGTNGEKKKVYVQSSATKVLPPQNYLFQLNTVDIAFICVASSTQSAKYPKDLLSIIRPKKTVLIHWEDFFITYSHNWKIETAKTIRGTNFNKFFKRYNQYNNLSSKDIEGLTGNTLMPMPGTMMYFK